MNQSPSQLPPQPWSPTRVDQMRLNALTLAVNTQGDPNKIKLASQYFEFLNEPYEAEEPVKPAPTKTPQPKGRR